MPASDLLAEAAAKGHLWRAASRGEQRDIEFLENVEVLQEGSLSVRGPQGESLAHVAAKAGCLSCLSMLQRVHTADVFKWKDNEGCTAAHAAASNLQTDTVWYLVGRSPGILQIRDSCGKLPVDHAPPDSCCKEFILGAMKAERHYSHLLPSGADIDKTPLRSTFASMLNRVALKVRDKHPTADFSPGKKNVTRAESGAAFCASDTYERPPSAPCRALRPEAEGKHKFEAQDPMETSLPSGGPSLAPSLAKNLKREPPRTPQHLKDTCAEAASPFQFVVFSSQAALPSLADAQGGQESVLTPPHSHLDNDVSSIHSTPATVPHRSPSSPPPSMLETSPAPLAKDSAASAADGVEGAPCSASHLEGAPCSASHLEGAPCSASHLEGAPCSASHFNLEYHHQDGCDVLEQGAEQGEESAHPPACLAPPQPEEAGGFSPPFVGLISNVLIVWAIGAVHLGDASLLSNVILALQPCFALLPAAILYRLLQAAATGWARDQKGVSKCDLFASLVWGVLVLQLATSIVLIVSQAPKPPAPPPASFWHRYLVLAGMGGG